MFAQFFYHLNSADDICALARCKMIMSDYIGGRIDRFCKSLGDEWYMGTITYNKKSGNDIVVYECDRNPDSVTMGL